MRGGSLPGCIRARMGPSLSRNERHPEEKTANVVADARPYKATITYPAAFYPEIFDAI